jgi:hypothetical protein
MSQQQTEGPPFNLSMKSKIGNFLGEEKRTKLQRSAEKLKVNQGNLPLLPDLWPVTPKTTCMRCCFVLNILEIKRRVDVTDDVTLELRAHLPTSVPAKRSRVRRGETS